MKFTLLVFLLQITLCSAQSSYTLNFIAKHRIGSVAFYKFGDNTPERKAYKQKLIFEVTASQADKFNVEYIIGAKKYRNQIWLDSGAVEIVFNIKSERLVVDTVLNSPLYYRAKHFENNLPDE